MDRQGTKGYMRRTQKDYSLAFKLQVVNEVERGEYTYKKAQRKYGIQGRSTVLVWLRKYGRLDWRANTAMRSNETPSRRIRELEKKLKRLWESIPVGKAEKEILHRAIDIADKELGTDIRKKCLALLSEVTTRPQGEENTASE